MCRLHFETLPAKLCAAGDLFGEGHAIKCSLGLVDTVVTMAVVLDKRQHSQIN